MNSPKPEPSSFLQPRITAKINQPGWAEGEPALNDQRVYVDSRQRVCRKYEHWNIYYVQNTPYYTSTLTSPHFDTAIYRESICKVCFPQRSAPPSSQTVTRQLTPDTPNVYKMETAGSAIEVQVTANFDNGISTNRLHTQSPTPNYPYYTTRSSNKQAIQNQHPPRHFADSPHRTPHRLTKSTTYKIPIIPRQIFT